MQNSLEYSKEYAEVEQKLLAHSLGDEMLEISLKVKEEGKDDRPCCELGME